MKIGNIELEGTPLFLAPMEDVTYKSFRWMCKKYGADVMYTEFVSSEALVRDIEKTKRSEWINTLLENHHNLIFATEPSKAVVFEPELLKEI